MIKEWKEVEGFSRYEISTSGVVREVKSLREMPQPFNNNFYCVNLVGDNGIKVLCKVHRLVAITYIENPENAHNVVHKDGDRSNNSVGNLFWKPKKVKEVVEKEVKTLTFQNRTYTYDEFSKAVGCEISTLRCRLKSGWSVRECFTGIKEFSGQGYEDELYWYPTKGEYEDRAVKVRILEQQTIREQKNIDKATKRAERKAKVHHGFGIFVNYPVRGIEGRKATRVYYVWQGIIARCYNPNHQSYSRYGGRGCTVSEKWKHFQDFAIWYQEEQKRGMGNAHINWHVDKDILVEGNLEYGPDNCCFVPDDVNTFFAGMGDNKGFTFYKGLYNSSVMIFGNKHQRSFKSEQEAVDWYWQGKSQAAKLLIWKYGSLLDSRVVERLSEI